MALATTYLAQVQEVKPASLNFTQFAAKHGFTDDYSVLDHGMLSRSGKVSKRSARASDARHLERSRSNTAGHVAYQAAIDKGEVVDPSGKVVPTIRANTKSAQQARKLVLGHLTSIKFWWQPTIGISSKTNKILPKYRKLIDKLLAEMEPLLKEYRDLDWAQEVQVTVDQYVKLLKLKVLPRS